MKRRQLALCCVVILSCSCEKIQKQPMYFLPGRNILNIIPEILGQAANQSTISPDEASRTSSNLQEHSTKLPVMDSSSHGPVLKTTEIARKDDWISTPTAEVIHDLDPRKMRIIPQFEIPKKFQPTAPFFDLTSSRSPPIPHRPFQHASLPQGLQVVPLPLKGSDHELVFNVSWNPPVGPALGFTKEYSVVVNSLTKTPDCDTLMCYECCISGRQTWTIVPSISYPVAETCAIKPGCTYQVTLTAHPWDGHTTANMIVELDECVAGVCSCAHASRLPAPLVSAQTISLQGGLFVNVTWSLPPSRNVRLPRGLAKKYYYISIGKQMVTDAHPSPWFTRGTSRKIDAMGTVSSGDQAKWFMLPINDKKDDKQKDLVPDVKLLARVNLIDERGCVGPAGNATAFDPTKENTTSYSAYVLWATLGGVIVVTIAAVVIVSAGAIKKFLRALRPAPVSAPLEPLRLRNAWFALPLNSNNENPSRGQVEQSPLYSHKVFQPPDEATDHWEIHRSRIHLGALIGSGAFGRVHAAQLHMPAGETITVAAKMLNENATNEEMEDFLGEINMLKHVGSHKHVIRLIGCCTLKAPLIALLEHAPRGDLLSLLRSARARRKVDEGSNETRRVDSETNGRPSEVECTTEYTNLSDSDPTLTEEKLCTDELKRNNDHYVAEPALHLDSSTMREYALQVALGMRHLEERGITHRDLAARNILVDGAGLLKVADFGLSRSGIYVHTKAKPVPLRWLAPEAILMSQYSSKSDVWAFAVLLWEIATFGGFPYAELSNHQVPEFLTAGQRLPKPVRASTRLYNLMTECWSEEPQKRPTFAQIVDKLNAQRQLYVDLEIIELFQDEAGLSDNDFSKSSAEWPCGR